MFTSQSLSPLRCCPLTQETVLAPATGAIVVGALVIAQRRAKKMGALADFGSVFAQRGLAGSAVDIFWQLDVMGIFLFIASFSLILVPLTLAGSAADRCARSRPNLCAAHDRP
jgi:hypothetical protein